MARVMYDHSASSIDELSVKHGERVSVLDDTRNWWRIKNKMGAEGFVPRTILELIGEEETGTIL